MNTLRSRLRTGVMSSIMAMLLLFGITIYVAIRRALLDQFDRALTATVEVIQASTSIEDGDVDIEYDPGADFDQTTYFQIRLADGSVLMRSLSLDDHDLNSLKGPEGSIQIRDVMLPGGRRGRAAGFRFTARSDEPGEESEESLLDVVVARDATALHEQVSRLAWLLIGAGAATVVAAFGASMLIVGRSLAPVAVAADQIAAIREDDLDARVNVAHLPGEIAPMAAKLNALLERLKDAFDRERAFTGDVAHELRTPVTGVRSTIEVALRSDRSPSEYRETLTECLEIADRMQPMIESLILLARLDAGQVTVQRDTVALNEIVETCWHAATASLPDCSVTFENQVPADLTCECDHDKLIMVLSNLLQNAGEYGDADGRVWVEGRVAGDFAELVIANTGCSLTPEEAKRVFDRFWRADASRQDTGTHAGLGLALVQRLTAILGGAIVCEVSGDGVFRARLRLPAAN